MSVKALTAVWECSNSKGAELIVMLALADWADADGWCWPSLTQIQKKTRLSRPTVVACLKRLLDAGELAQSDDRHIEQIRSKARQLGYQATAIYKIEVGKQLNYLESAEVVKSSSVGGKNDDAQVVKSADSSLLVEPSLDPSKETVNTRPDLPGLETLTPESLREIWNTYRGRLPKCVPLSAERRASARARIKEHPSAEEWIALVKAIEANRWYGSDGPAVGFEYILKPRTWTLFAEGRLAPKQSTKPTTADDVRKATRDSNAKMVGAMPIYTPNLDEVDDDEPPREASGAAR